MATVTVTPGYNWVSGEVVTPAKMNLAATPTASVSNIVNADIAGGAAIAASKLALAGAITDADLATTLNLSGKTVTLPDNNISTSKIANAAVTAAKLDGAQAGAAPIYGCRAWVKFDGTAGTTVSGEFRCTIHASGNVTKVVKSAPGIYVATFTAAMPTNNYACVTGYDLANGISSCRVLSTSVGSCQIGTNTSTGALADARDVSVAVFA